MADLEAGLHALEAGEWAAARAAFEAVLAERDSAAAQMGLGDALAWLGETEAAVQAWQRAYGAFRRGPGEDLVQAAVAAINLSIAYHTSLGNDAAARGWLDRLARLVRDLEPLRGWELVIRAVLEPQDPEAAHGWSREALELARRYGDRDLELCALCEAGAALAHMGRTEEGLALLGEAMAGALGGEPDRLDTVVYCCCRMIATCSAVFEHGRAASWIRAAEQFTRRYGGLHLQLHCRVHYGGVLLATGRWEEAETELLEAAAASARAERVLHAEAVARLAELRVAQGRLDEAERLLAGLDERPATVAPRAALHLAAGRPDAAALAARRGGGPSCVELLVQAEIALGAIEPALSRALDLVQTGDADVALAYGERAAGRALIAAGEPGQAVERLERALAIFARREMPYEAARARLALAQALSAGRPEAAAAEASGAQDVFERLGAGRDADAAAALLRSLGIRAGRRGPRGADVLTKRETEVLALLAEGYSNAAIAERLFLSRKTVEHHVHRVLLKLGLRGRSEAAAYLVRDRGAK